VAPVPRSAELAEPLNHTNALLADHADRIAYEEDHRQRDGQDDDQRSEIHDLPSL
jgi:hypothetical protein